jgi:hypothetical protein
MMGERRLEEALEVVASGGSTLDLSDIEALRVIVHFAIGHVDCRRVLSEPSEEMVEAAARESKGYCWACEELAADTGKESDDG